MWLRALERTAPILKDPEQILPTVIEGGGQKFGGKLALLSGRECLSYRTLAERSNQYSRWALAVGLEKGETVCLLMRNRPEYLAIWLGITRVGGVVALLNSNLVGSSLGHCVDLVHPKHLIVQAELLETLTNAAPHLKRDGKVWVHGTDSKESPRIDRTMATYSGDALTKSERRTVTINDLALYIFTSGTTGLPKAANVSHGRLLQWSYWFAGMMDTRPEDRLYNCLPMYHSAGGVLATGAVLTAGGSVVISDGFSVRQFWRDVVLWDCTLFQYVGELCRYLAQADVCPFEEQHRIRMCCGNGLRGDVWASFEKRFRIPQIVEFYASTEGNVSLFNMDGEPGAIGRIPAYLGHANPVALIRIDIDTREPVRNKEGFCIRCAGSEVGEALGRVRNGQSNFGARFEGYTSREATSGKVLRDVFERGDAWYRSGDLMRQDERGYFYFVDRLGDTFRWKGENVSAEEISQVICQFPGVQQAIAYGVEVPGTEGRAGMAAIASDDRLNLAALQRHLRGRLAAYAVPVFLRLCKRIDLTDTFKPVKADLQREGYNPSSTGDSIWFQDRGRQAFVRVDQELYERIQQRKLLL